LPSNRENQTIEEEYMAMIEREEGQRTTIAAAAALPKNQRLTLAASSKLTDINPCPEPMQIKIQMIFCSIDCSLVVSDER